MKSLGPSPWPDCGTLRAARRHNRRKEPTCTACTQAEARSHADRSGTRGDNIAVVDLRPVRNGLPEPARYVYRAPRPPWVQAILARTGMRHQMPGRRTNVQAQREAR